MGHKVGSCVALGQPGQASVLIVFGGNLWTLSWAKWRAWRDGLEAFARGVESLKSLSLCLTAAEA